MARQGCCGEPLAWRGAAGCVALEGEEGRAVDLTPLAVEVIAESFGEWLREEIRLRGELQEPQQLRVSVGRDPRLSGPRLGAALFAGLARAGCSVFDMGLATTQAPEV